MWESYVHRYWVKSISCYRKITEKIRRLICDLCLIFDNSKIIYHIGVSPFEVLGLCPALEYCIFGGWHTWHLHFYFGCPLEDGNNFRENSWQRWLLLSFFFNILNFILCGPLEFKRCGYTFIQHKCDRCNEFLYDHFKII